MLNVPSTLRLIAALFFLCGAAAGPASAAPVDEVEYASLLRTINPHLHVEQSLAFARSLVADAERSNLDPRLIVALVTVESHWRPNAISRVGARGLGQLMPSTAAQMRVNAWDPAQNIRGAATYLRAMLDRFASSGDNTLRYAIGAYNAGPEAVEKYHGIPPYQETQTYVRRVLATFHRIRIRFSTAFPGLAEGPASPDGKLWLGNTDASALPVTASAPDTVPVPLPADAVPAALPPATPVTTSAPPN